MPGSTARGKGESIGETAASLLKLEGEKIEVVPSSEVGKAKIISDSDLEKLLDRSPEVFAGRGKGWTSGTKAAEGGRQPVTGDVAFEVFQAPVDQCNDSLAAMMGEKLE
jgi:ATP-dependent DNA helicase